MGISSLPSWHRNCSRSGRSRPTCRFTLRDRTLLDFLVLRTASRLGTRWVRGRTLHRRALAAAASGAHADAEQWFEAAAARYRKELQVEPLARLRVHQLMVRARAASSSAREAEMMLEIVRGLNRLDRLESFSVPYDLCDARAVLSSWIGDAATSEPGPTEGRAAA